jgi:hypothetical protein
VGQEGEEVATAAGPEVMAREVVVVVVEVLETVAMGPVETVAAVGEALVLRPLLTSKYSGERLCCLCSSYILTYGPEVAGTSLSQIQVSPSSRMIS